MGIQNDTFSFYMINFKGCAMRIIDTVPYFVNNYEPSIDFLNNYYKKYPDIFKEYFAYHCKDTEERHSQSLRKYQEYFLTIKQVHENIIPIIQEVTDRYLKLFEVEFPIDVNLIVGGFGSNAYTLPSNYSQYNFCIREIISRT